MRLKEPFVKKHVHSFKLCFSHPDDLYVFRTWDLERECTDCGEKQHTRITQEEKESLPESVLALGDFQWKSGAL